MAQEISVGRAPVDQWQAAILRVTAFSASPTALDQVGSWWQTVVRKAPDTETIRRGTGELQQEGSFGGGRLTLRVDPMRVDWVQEAAASEEQDEIPSVGQFPDAIQVFGPLAKQWVEQLAPPLQRLAFGAVLNLPMPDRERAYTQVQQYLPYVRIVPSSTDFLYQINRRVPSRSGVEGLQINRLCKWSAASWRRAQISLGSITQATHLGTPRFACHLELDINTAPEFERELPKPDLGRILEELIAYGAEITRDGDT